jgi:chemotaxis protein methyltransferase CheR
VRPAPAPAEVERFRELVGLHVGLQFDDARLSFLADVLWRRLGDGRHSCPQYLRELEQGLSQPELDGLARELTVPETYFFRHLDQFRAFAEAAIPARVHARRHARQLRILSAGCASGEEAYTLAIAIRELGLDPSWDVQVRAVDMNPAVLERGRRGRYSTWSMRETPPELQERWFSRHGRDFQLDESIRKQVVFEQRNLAEDDVALWQPETFDVVFCRNVMMYFTPKCAKAVVERITRSLAPGGYLFLGHAENLRGMSHEFHLCHTHNAFYYQRRTPGDEATQGLPWSYPSPPQRQAEAPIDAGGHDWFEAIGTAADNIRVLASSSMQMAAVAPAPVLAGPAALLALAAPGCDLRPPLDLLSQERFGEALGLVAALPPESAGDPDVLLLEAVLLAHSGHPDRAAAVCSELLLIDELNAGAHYVLALCCEGAGQRSQAIEHDQVASYLDPAFAMPRLHLGLLARRAGQQTDARRELGLALALLQREDSSRLLFFGGGFGREALLTLCRAELVACGGRP